MGTLVQPPTAEAAGPSWIPDPGATRCPAPVSPAPAGFSLTTPDGVPPSPELHPGPDATIRTWVEIDLDAVRHNCRVAQECLGGGGPRVLAVVKADGYGLGMIPVARALEDLVRAFAVANTAEACQLQAAGLRPPVYLLGPALPSEWDLIARHGFYAAVSSVTDAAGLGEAAARHGRVLPVHVVIDTGMGRMGALPDQAPAVTRAVHTHPWLHLDSVTTHFPSADEDHAFTTAQTRRFHSLMEDLRAAGLTADHVQLANSAGLTGYPDATRPGTLGRAGLMLYGLSPLPEHQPRLQPVITWKTRITQVRQLPAGHGISYGRTFITTRPTLTATLAAGYADGYPRQLAGRNAEVLIGGHRCPVLGRVTMDQVIADVTGLPAPPRPGDEAVLAGRQGDQELSPVELAEKAGTIAWDILTGLGTRVLRCYYQSSRMFRSSSAS